MRLITRDDLWGKCEACGLRIEFELCDDGDVAYYEAEDIVNKWMDHQLHVCSSVIDSKTKTS